MSETDLKLFELLSSKELQFGCLVRLPGWLGGKIIVPWDSSCERVDKDGIYKHSRRIAGISEMEIIGQEPRIEDLHRWLWQNGMKTIAHVDGRIVIGNVFIPYDSSKPLLSQDESTKLAIISLIESHEQTR